MPVTKKYTLDELMTAARYYAKKTGKRVTFEYILIDKYNSSMEDAKRLVRLTHGLKCKINIIPSNSDDPNYPPPDKDQILAFDRYLNEHHRTVTVRLRKGWEIQAACGQLYAKNELPIRNRKNQPRKIVEN
jgi:23S rRNA (adenine2503-C2)-methyltransferase